MINATYYTLLLSLVGISFYGMGSDSHAPMVLAGCGLMILVLLMVANRGFNG